MECKEKVSKFLYGFLALPEKNWIFRSLVSGKKRVCTYLSMRLHVPFHPFATSKRPERYRLSIRKTGAKAALFQPFLLPILRASLSSDG